jgi:uncharacterized integral membrane protein
MLWHVKKKNYILCLSIEKEDNKMKLDQSPFFRKPIIPWYDSNLLCWIFIIICTISLVFAIVGIKVALFNHLFSDYVWLPICLGLLALFVMIKILIKLIKRGQNF